MGALVITHYQRILNYIKPDFVHVFVDGRIVEEGGPELAQRARGRRLRSVAYRRERRQPDGTDRDRDRPGDRLRLRIKYGFHDSDEAKDYFFKSGRGLSHELVEAISEHKNEPDWMRKFRLKCARLLPRPADARPGAATSPGSTSRTSTTTSSRPRSRPNSWEDLPADIKDTWDKLGHPRGGEEVPRRRRRPVRVRGRLPQAPGGAREAGRALPRHGLGPARARGASSSSTSGRSSRRTTTSSRR